jgi:membrane protein DedA with SNARE-associated domain
MPDFLDPETAAALLRQWGYAVVFAAMLLENAGVPLPGETITLLGGYAAGSGELNGLGVVGAAFAGALLGDNIGYWVGRRLGWGLMVRVGGLLRQTPEKMESLRSGFLSHAGKSVFLGRFVAVLRVLAGPMAGAVGMPYGRVVFCKAGGALLWATTMVGLAWIGGRWIPFRQMATGVVELGLGLLLIVLVVLVVPRLLARLEARADGS